MKKLVNLRLPCLLCIALVAGIAIGYLFNFYRIDLIWITAAIAITAVIVIITAVSSRRLKIIAILCLATIFFITGAVNCFMRLDVYSESRLTNGQTYTINATVYEKGEYSHGEYVILSNAYAGDMKLNCKVLVYLNDVYGDFCDVGYTVTYTAPVLVMDTYPYGELNYNAQDDVKYYSFVYGGLSAKYGFSLFGSIRTAIRNSLFKNLDYDTAAVAYAMLTGNTQRIEDNTIGSFRYGGIAHIFAVSGLHIGIIYGTLYFILKRLNVNKYLRAALCVIPVFFYTGVCGFTLSSVRAAIMCTVSLFARLGYRKYDGLNSLSVSVILILFITPLSIFSVGLQLSVCAVGSIIILSRTIARLFKRLPRKLASAVSVSLAAQAGTVPVLLADFGYVSGAGLILNIVVLPILSAVFVIIFIGVLIAAAMPFAAFLLPYAALPLQAVISFFINAGFEKSLISGFGAGAFIPVYFIGLLFLSDRLNIKFIYRSAVACGLAVILCTYVLVRTFVPFSGFEIVVSAYYGGGEVLFKSRNGNVLVVTEGITPSRTPTMLNGYYATDLSAVIILGGENCVTFYGDLNIVCDKVYVYYGDFPLQPYEKTEVIYADSFTVAGIDFKFGDGTSLRADCGGVTVGICDGDYLPDGGYDLTISDYVENGESVYCVGFNERNIEYNVYNCGDIIFSVKNGKLNMR